MNAFFKSQSCYSPLTWLMHSRKLNNKINRLHEKCLHVAYNDVCLHLKSYLKEINLFQCTIEMQSLSIELFKIFNGICPDIMKDVFPLITSSNNDIRSRRTFKTHISRPLSQLNRKNNRAYHFCMNCLNDFWTVSARGNHSEVGYCIQKCIYAYTVWMLCTQHVCYFFV